MGQMVLVGMNRWAFLGRREERNTGARGAGEGECISKSPLIFLSNNQVLDKVLHESKQTGDTITATAFITFQGY